MKTNTHSDYALFALTRRAKQRGFSLVEVILAIGVISLAVVAMLGLFAPTMGSVKKVIDSERANVVSGHIRSQINDHMTFAQISSLLPTVNDEAFSYVWDYEDINLNTGTVNASEIVMTPPGRAANGLSTTIATLNNGTTTVDIADSDDWDTLGGMVFVVKFTGITLGSGTYPYGSTDAEAYIPFLVSIYQVSPQQIEAGLGVADLTDANLVQSYPFAKLR